MPAAGSRGGLCAATARHPRTFGSHRELRPPLDPHPAGGGVLFVTLDAGPLSPIGVDLVHDLAGLVDTLYADPGDVRVVVFDKRLPRVLLGPPPRSAVGPAVAATSSPWPAT